GAPPRTHWHPPPVETVEVLDGALPVEVGGHPSRTLGVGERLEIPARTAHRMWNAGPARARASWTITPPGRTLAMFTHIHDGVGGRLVRDLTLLVRFRREFRLGSPRA
ncbi:cupin domain-containing protein, partial [Pseudactinotalea sp.]|uniref:cupin domain-containing protein n=1 Tax=Pseudactinotalea sp. TaxID=1926260 RepID=UPI003B3A6BF1